MTEQLNYEDMAFSSYYEVTSTVRLVHDWIAKNFAPPYNLDICLLPNGDLRLILINRENFIQPKLVITNLTAKRYYEMQDKPELLVQFLEDLKGSIN